MKKLKLALSVICLSSFIYSCTSSTPNSNNPSTSPSVSENDLKAIFNDYKGYTKINDTLVNSSQHGGVFVFTMINKEGIDSFREKKYPYKDGSIVVKESHSTNDPNSEINTLYIMKKLKDYDKENNDWYYAMLDNKGGLKDGGKIQMCINCHKGAKDKDYVFGF